MFLFHPFRSFFWPIVLVIIGLLLLLTNLGIIPVTIWKWWPVILIAIAVYMLTRRRKKNYLFSSLLGYGILRKLMKEERVKEKIQTAMDIAEGLLEKQLEKLHKKYAKKKGKGK